MKTKLFKHPEVVIELLETEKEEAQEFLAGIVLILSAKEDCDVHRYIQEIEEIVTIKDFEINEFMERLEGLK